MLSILLALLVLIVAYFHYLQGFFSATASAVIAAVSALVAFNYFEPIVDKFQPSKFADSAHAMVLVVLFATTYLILRSIFDKVIPGNLRLPTTLDKIGGAAMGVIAGVMATGVIAVAAQALPLGPTIAGYSRYRVIPDAEVTVQESERQQASRRVYDGLVADSISLTSEDQPVAHQSLTFLPVDDWVLGLLYRGSDGSVSGGQSFSRIHPDYLQELFGNRIGIEIGAKRSASPIGGEEVVSVQRIYTVESIPQIDAEPAKIRRREDDNPLPKTLKADDTHALLVVRLQFKLDASDEDKLVRISTGSVRLVATAPDVNGHVVNQNFFPVGTVDRGDELLVSKPDDFLFVNADKSADFLFVVPRSVLPEFKSLPVLFPDDSTTFIEAKRYARIPLAGLKIDFAGGFEQVSVLRKIQVAKEVAEAHPTVDLLKGKLTGAWSTKLPNGDPAVLTYRVDGSFIEQIEHEGQHLEATGKWDVISGDTNGLVFDRKLDAGGPLVRRRVVFKGTDAATMTDVNNPSKPATSLKRTS